MSNPFLVDDDVVTNEYHHDDVKPTAPEGTGNEREVRGTEVNILAWR
jgi:hypothetical protein